MFIGGSVPLLIVTLTLMLTLLFYGSNFLLNAVSKLTAVCNRIELVYAFC